MSHAVACAELYRDVAKKLKATVPGLELLVYSDRDIDSRRDEVESALKVRQPPLSVAVSGRKVRGESVRFAEGRGGWGLTDGG